MTDHANELRRYARKIAHPAGDVPSVMLAAADEIERLQSVIKDRRIRDGVLADDDERSSRARGVRGAESRPGTNTALCAFVETRGNSALFRAILYRWIAMVVCPY